MTDPTLNPEMYGPDDIGKGKAALDARRQPRWPDHMDPQEARICGRLISQILAAGYAIRVHDGEDPATDITSSRSKIQAATAATDLTVYQVYDWLEAKGWTIVGQIFLVHGNGPDVIHDLSWHPQIEEMEDLMNAWFEHAVEGED